MIGVHVSDIVIVFVILVGFVQKFVKVLDCYSLLYLLFCARGVGVYVKSWKL